MSAFSRPLLWSRVSAHDRACLYLCGLGNDGPRQCTLEVLQALASCAVAYHDLQDRGSIAFLRLLCRDVRTAAPASAREADRLIEGLAAEVRSGALAAFVSAGHPAYAGGLAARLERAFRESGLATERLPAVSAAGAGLTRLQISLGLDSRGIQSCGLKAALRSGWKTHPDLPLVVSFHRAASQEETRRLARALARNFSAGKPLLLFADRPGAKAARATPESLPGRWRRLTAGRSLLVSPARPEPLPEVPLTPSPPPARLQGGASAPSVKTNLIGFIKRRLTHLEMDDALAELSGTMTNEDLRKGFCAEMLERLRRERPSKASARVLAVEGKLLADLGRPEQALAAFDRAGPVTRRDAQARIWRAEALLADRQFAAAASELDFTLPAGPIRWTGLLRVRPGGNGWEEFARRKETEEVRSGKAVLAAVLQILAAQSEGGLKALAEAIGEPPEESLLLLRAAVHRRQRSFQPGLADSESAFALRPSWEACIERSLLLELMGYHQEALAQAETGLSLGSDPALTAVLRARLLRALGRRRQALEALAKACAAEPRLWPLRVLRARLFAETRRGREALREIDSAEALSGESLLHERISSLALLDRDQEALRMLDAAALNPDAAPLWRRGLLHFQRRRYRAAARDLAVAAGLRPQAQDPVAREARQLSLLSTAFSRTPRPPPGRACRLVIIGLGAVSPYQATVQGLWALSRRDVIFSNFPGDAGILRFLALLAPEVRPMKWDLAASIDEMAALAGAGGAVGFATRAHPLVYGNPSYHLIRRFRSEGLTFQIFNAVSSMDVMPVPEELAREHEVLGAQVFDSRVLLDGRCRLNTAIPLTIYFLGKGADEVRQVAEALRRHYPAGQDCFAYDSPFECARVRLADLLRRDGTVTGRNVLVVAPMGV